MTVMVPSTSVRVTRRAPCSQEDQPALAVAGVAVGVVGVGAEDADAAAAQRVGDPSAAGGCWECRSRRGSCRRRTTPAPRTSAPGRRAPPCVRCPPSGRRSACRNVRSQVRPVSCFPPFARPSRSGGRPFVTSSRRSARARIRCRPDPASRSCCARRRRRPGCGGRSPRPWIRSWRRRRRCQPQLMSMSSSMEA